MDLVDHDHAKPEIAQQGNHSDFEGGNALCADAQRRCRRADRREDMQIEPRSSGAGGACSKSRGVWVMPAAGSYSGAYLRERFRAIIVLPMPEAPWTRRPGIRVCCGASIRLCNLSSTRSARGKPIQMSD
jgi:hypothetical protein